MRRRRKKRKRREKRRTRTRRRTRMGRKGMGQGRMGWDCMATLVVVAMPPATATRVGRRGATAIAAAAAMGEMSVAKVKVVIEARRAKVVRLLSS